jgi:hypothetical protein
MPGLRLERRHGLYTYGAVGAGYDYSILRKKTTKIPCVEQGPNKYITIDLQTILDDLNRMYASRPLTLAHYFRSIP